MRAAWSQKAWVQISAPSLFLWATLDEFFNLIHRGVGRARGLGQDRHPFPKTSCYYKTSSPKGPNEPVSEIQTSPAENILGKQAVSTPNHSVQGLPVLSTSLGHLRA